MTLGVSTVAAGYSCFGLQNDIVDIILAVSMVMLSLTLIIIEWKFTVSYRKAEHTRRDAFLDNALGSRMANTKSEGYYDNDNVGYGIRKILSNLHESCVYSARESEEMFKESEKKLCVISGLMILVALINLFSTQFVVALADIIISTDMIKDYLELKTLKGEMEAVEEECKQAWEHYHEDGSSADNKTIAMVLRAFVRYETALAYASIMLDPAVFRKLRNQIADEGEELQLRYQIR